MVYTNGIRCLPEIRADYNVKKIVFVGNMRTLQNQDAVQYFTKAVFPAVKRQVPGTVFNIIGAEPPRSIQEIADGKNIVVSGFVDSVEREISDAAVAVAPVRIAAGIQNKVLISMACGIPVVLTSLIAAAIPELESGKNCLIADTDEEISAAVVSLIQDASRRSAIARNGYELMKRAYSWNERLEGYEL
jgi:glycosyltransferase involved in cell wall biosynthesis